VNRGKEFGDIAALPHIFPIKIQYYTFQKKYRKLCQIRVFWQKNLDKTVFFDIVQQAF
jgi:hypothetical protein